MRDLFSKEGRSTEKAFIERFFGTLKHKHIYVNPAKEGLELYSSVEKFMKKFNLRNTEALVEK